jgi:hypothetical protein
VTSFRFGVRDSPIYRRYRRVIGEHLIAYTKPGRVGGDPEKSRRARTVLPSVSRLRIAAGVSMTGMTGFPYLTKSPPPRRRWRAIGRGQKGLALTGMGSWWECRLPGKLRRVLGKEA